MSENTRREPGPSPDRPDFSEAYGVSANVEGMLPWDRADERLAESRNYWIGTTRPDGRPHAAPVWGVWVAGALVFGTDQRSQKARNIRSNPALTMHLESGEDVVIVEGVVEEADPELLAAAEAAYRDKYGMGLEEAAGQGGVWYALRPVVAYAWLESDFARSPTRWTFDA